MRQHRLLVIPRRRETLDSFTKAIELSSQMRRMAVSPGKPIHGSTPITPPDTLVQRTDHIVPLLPASIISLSQSFSHRIHQLFVSFSLSLFLCHVDSIQVESTLDGQRLGADLQCEFERVECLSGVTVRYIGEEGKEVWGQTGWM